MGPRGTTLLGRAAARPASFASRLPGLLGPSGRRGTRRGVPLGAGGRFFRRLRGDLTAGPAPGLAPSPGRSWLLAAAGVPIKAVPMRPLAVTVTHPGLNLFPSASAMPPEDRGM
ncbi:hypothetical protein Arub01_14140 [Actinomadura rubrobrunea]|uniref:Uncharacterized protein n=1 Tax=Actinomadura rubrobrunea TaxID=115335 RepID=A0A9W6UVZ9_9ACTN|nr:hypothetical protein Arub01_14140 [Actinomadura rubrobrunea]